ncbi:MAG TPA: gamma-glutamylcyclotransferase family protein [Steroidobacteraceae bacterium]|nr:gamma-glutamylcyclotransferase family protein [Steroidobacteraceae bacterium]
MPRLFSYGSLQLPATQLATFGRLLAGSRDALLGFELCEVAHGDKLLANVIRSRRADSHVSGTTFEVTESELAAADDYERGDAYVRIQTTLASGDDAWVYVDAASIS